MDNKTLWFQVFHFRLKDTKLEDLDDIMPIAEARADKMLEYFEKRFPPSGLSDEVLMRKYNFIEMASHGFKYKAYLSGEHDLFVCERLNGDIYFEYFSHYSYFNSIDEAKIGAIKYYLDNIKGK